MANELAVNEPNVIQTVTIPQRHAVAINATEMKEANTQIREHVETKVATLKAEIDEVSDAAAIAATNGWDTKSLCGTERRLRTQLTYYEKLVLVLDAGYTLVPNMPCDQFAIRVKRTRPTQENSNWSSHPNPLVNIEDEKEQHLPAGEGRYESPVQLVREYRDQTAMPDGKTRYNVTAKATDWSPIEFPFAAAVPVVMTATQAAMALKLFDRIGVVPQSLRAGNDPIILGQIVRKVGYGERVTSFLIAWHLDLRTL